MQGIECGIVRLLIHLADPQLQCVFQQMSLRSFECPSVHLSPLSKIRKNQQSFKLSYFLLLAGLWRRPSGSFTAMVLCTLFLLGEITEFSSQLLIYGGNGVLRKERLLKNIFFLFLDYRSSSLEISTNVMNE